MSEESLGALAAQWRRTLSHQAHVSRAGHSAANHGGQSMCMKLQETAHVLPPFAHSAAETATQSKRHGIKWNNMVPLLYAPALPLGKPCRQLHALQPGCVNRDN
eukprot:scaffold5524_cov426-Prasinococcus_capsulatus_cf.AAC.2